MFKIGDKVICRVPTESGSLIKGREYIINGVFGSFVSVDGSNSHWLNVRFKLKENVMPGEQVKKVPHKHAEVIKAWADGAQIQVYINGHWREAQKPEWFHDAEYRVKPEKVTLYLPIFTYKGEFATGHGCNYKQDAETTRLGSAWKLHEIREIVIEA